ncbi:MAG TPA: 2-succinyl-6-hydroxy-2,4-cyclohexadiene-1-carboxylate synthase [bacterium]|nr:2-succinyl-6-hydroxy-2,4-cyclohexadiene-1-carboxylate synthase [bacterium]
MAKLKLAYDADPNLHDGRPVLVLLHGFTQDRHAWDWVRDALRRVGPTVAVDLIGHGESPKPEALAPYRLDACLEQLDDVLEALKVPSAWWMGYSMGGRMALQMAVHRAARVEGLVLVSTTAGIPELDVRAERIKADEALAARIPGWGMEAFVDYWMGLPLFDSLQRLPPNQRLVLRRQRLANSPVGLANSLRGMGAGALPSVWGHLRDLSLPALVVAGELDEKFAALARSLAAALPESHLSIVPDCGHSVMLEQPQRFVSAVQGFFQRLKAA